MKFYCIFCLLVIGKVRKVLLGHVATIAINIGLLLEME